MKLKQFVNEDQALHSEELNLFEMSNLHPEDTGLENLVVWISAGGDKLKHGPRIKVVRGKKWRNDLASTVPLTGIPRIIGKAELTQDEFAELMKWININRDVILLYWNDRISTAKMINNIEKI